MKTSPSSKTGKNTLYHLIIKIPENFFNNFLKIQGSRETEYFSLSYTNVTLDRY